ncbi:MAG: fluoride efflux transporter CrcB [Bacteroidota bacterium]|nr:fluoride efflux transporter CrcB [Bacteroidota bacterium]
MIFAIGAGSFIGGISRYLLSQTIQNRFLSTFPFGTFVVNILGCLLIGFVFGLFDKGTITAEWRLFIATGILGGFTTFSAFSNESIGLLRNGQLFYALLYIASSVIIGLFATYIGIILTKLI